MARKIIDTKLAFRRICLILCDTAVIIAASALGLLLRFDLNPSKVDMHFVESLWRYLPIKIICTLIIFYILKLYHSMWRFAGIVEMQNLRLIICFHIHCRTSYLRLSDTKKLSLPVWGNVILSYPG